METASTKIRADKQPKPKPYDPVKAKFLKNYSEAQETDLLKEQLFEQQFHTKILRKMRSDINTIKWIVLISFIAAIIVGVLIGIQ